MLADGEAWSDIQAQLRSDFKWRSADELADKLEQFAREAIPAFL
jgi:hypothetical protein